MTNAEIESRMQRLTQQERETTNEILALINLAEERRLFLERGYPSLFEWLVKSYGYSHSAAYRRIQAARLLKAVPEVAEKLELGEVNLSTLAQVQVAIRAKEKISGTRLSADEKADIVCKTENQSTLQTERTLISIFPEIASMVRKTTTKAVDESISRLSVNLSNETLDDLERVKELLSHSHPNAGIAEVISVLARTFIAQKDPLKRKSAAAAQCATGPLTKSTKSEVIKMGRGKCQYRDPVTGRNCGSSYQIEVDHVQPRALGGGNEFNNLRCLCRKHNSQAAENLLGQDIANRWRLKVITR